MRISYRLLNCLVLLVTLGLTSCGYLSDKPPANAGIYKSAELQKSCQIDVDKLAEIFKADQKQQIKCLEENFLQFTKYVRSQDQGSVSETELNVFIRRFFQGKSDAIVKGLGLVFQLNMLLLRDEADHISKTNISPLFDLLVHVNQEAVNITQILKKMSDDKNQASFWDLRTQFNDSVTRFSKFTLDIINNSPGLQKQLNIKDFILDASTKLGNKEISSDTIDSLIFLKRILVAGDKEVITSGELKTVIKDLPKIMSLSFDIYFVRNSNFATDSDEARFYLSSLNDLYHTIQFNQADFDLFTIDQLIKLSQELIKGHEVVKFKPSLVSIKTRLIGGSADTFSLKDLKNTLDIIVDFGERNYFNNVTYNALRMEIEKNEPILFLPQLDQPKDYDIFSPRRIAELHADFQDIAVNYRYFRTKSEGIPTYGNKIVRNKYGFIEASSIKWLSTKLLKAYGHKNEAGQLQVTKDEFRIFLDEMKPLLEEFKLWSPTPDTFASNAVLLADLFQDKSNGDLEVNITEASQYIQMILSAVEISNKFSSELSRECDAGSNPDDPAFNTQCFNEHFYDTLLNKLDYKKYFPRLDEYVANTPKEEVDQYLIGVEGFARDIPDPKLPMNKRDSILTLGSLINIESTFIRFDTNRDGILDYDELVDAFKVYRPAIIALAHLKPSDEVYSQAIFLYLVSKMEIPPMNSWLDNAKFLAFHKCSTSSYCREKFMDKIEAKRLNIGKLLYYLVIQNQKPATDGSFVDKPKKTKRTLRSLLSGLFHHSEQED